MRLITYTHPLRTFLEQTAGHDGGADTDLYCFEQARPNCDRCKNTRRVGHAAFPLDCPACGVKPNG